jgi:DNA-directed RNA polymerase specialized sigma24 family protein
MPEPSPDPALTARIRSRQFTEDYPRYLTYASRRLRRRGVEGDGGIQAASIVSDAALACLSGARTWPANLDFHRFFRRVMRSLMSHELGRRRAERRRREGSPEPDEVAAASARAGEVQDARREVAAVVRALAGDTRAVELLGALADGAEKPSDVAEMLGWSPAQAKAVRVRLKRRLAAAGLLGKGREKGAAGTDRRDVCP